MKNHFFLLYTRYNGIDILSVKEKEILSSGSHSGPILPHIVLLFYITCLPSIISSFIYFFYCHFHLYKVGDHIINLRLIDWCFMPTLAVLNLCLWVVILFQLVNLHFSLRYHLSCSFSKNDFEIILWIVPLIPYNLFISKNYFDIISWTSRNWFVFVWYSAFIVVRDNKFILSLLHKIKLGKVGQDNN